MWPCFDFPRHIRDWFVIQLPHGIFCANKDFFVAMTQNNANHCPPYPLNIQKWLCRHSLNSKTCFFPSVLFSFQIFCFCFTLFAIKYLSLVWTKAKKFFRPHSCNFSMSKLPKMFPVITLPGNSYWKSFFGWRQQSTSEVSCLGECWERFSMIKRLAILACGFFRLQSNWNWMQRQTGKQVVCLLRHPSLQ